MDWDGELQEGRSVPVGEVIGYYYYCCCRFRACIDRYIGSRTIGELRDGLQAYCYLSGRCLRAIALGLWKEAVSSGVGRAIRGERRALKC